MLKQKKRPWRERFGQLWAKLRRTFWMTCPRCRRPFGGYHAHARTQYCPDRDQHYRIVCHHCAKELLPKQVPGPRL